MNVIVVIDEYTDVESASAVREIVDIVNDAINNPHKPRPDGESILGEMTRQFWERAIKTATPSSQKHFIEAFTDYLHSVVEQAADRDNNHIRTVGSYLKTRRENIGARPSYVPAELGLNLPDEAFYHPVVTELSYNIAELIILDNSRQRETTATTSSPSSCTNSTLIWRRRWRGWRATTGRSRTSFWTG